MAVCGVSKASLQRCVVTLDGIIEAFAFYEKWGIVGIKIDFRKRDDPERVQWYAKIVKAAAEHHLMVNFHGAYKPTGTKLWKDATDSDADGTKRVTEERTVTAADVLTLHMASGSGAVAFGPIVCFRLAA